MVKARLAMSPRFDRVSNDEALRVIGEHDPELLNIDADQAADQAQGARLTRRLRRLAAAEDLVHLLGTYTSKRDLAKAAEQTVLSFEERAAEQTEAAAQALIDRFIAAHAVDVAEALINLQAGRHQAVHRAAVDDEAVQAVADQLVAPNLGDVLLIDRDGFLQVVRHF